MITYVSTADNIDEDMLHGFFVGWPDPPSPQTHLELLKRTQVRVLALDTDIHRVVGFITAITDGILSAYIPLLEVLPEYQGRGIGRELVRRMLAELDGLYMIDLVCDPGLQSFYEKLGMKPYTAMMIRNMERQSGGA
jgi:ribosomal protein S18 acetylase RimI-like enzyme